ncbi:MAG TPA: VOC family protein [Gemmatimonadaceae bacterium]|jgi:predicted enzyme related to lactoylglutathione lyase
MKKKPGRSTRKPVAKRSRRKSSTASTISHVHTPGLDGWITHTELASSNPAATKAWCAKVLGWTFKPGFPMPGGGEYMLFAYSDKGGGGIRPTNPSETPGSSFTVHVADTRAAFEQALREGAEEIMPPTPVMPGVTIAVVRAPGGVRVGFSGP